MNEQAHEVDEERLHGAICCLAEMEMINEPRQSHPILRLYLSEELIRREDPWVDAAMSCAKPEDVLPVALWFFVADVKSGLYDAVAPQAEVTA